MRVAKRLPTHVKLRVVHLVDVKFDASADAVGLPDATEVADLNEHLERLREWHPQEERTRPPDLLPSQT